MSVENEIVEIRVGKLVKKDAPKISIITPSYNTAAYIGETLDSMLAQTFTDYEIIIINDAAPDIAELKIVLENYWDKIIFIDKATNGGTSAARNVGVGQSRGELLAFLDPDDIWMPTYLEEQLEFLERDNYDMVYTDAVLFGITKYAGVSLMRNNPPQGDITRQQLIEGKCHILPSGMLIKKSVYHDVGGFDDSVSRTEDFDLWMRMVFKGTKIGYLRKNLFKFRLRPASFSGDYLLRLERCTNIWRDLLKKMPFTEQEKVIINHHIEVGDTDVLRARGRLYLNQERWDDAKVIFREAKQKANKLNLPFAHRMKLSAILFLLNVSPHLLAKLMRFFRSEEVQYMSFDEQSLRSTP